MFKNYVNEMLDKLKSNKRPVPADDKSFERREELFSNPVKIIDFRDWNYENVIFELIGREFDELLLEELEASGLRCSMLRQVMSTYYGDISFYIEDLTCQVIGFYDEIPKDIYGKEYSVVGVTYMIGPSKFVMKEEDFIKKRYF